MEATRIFDASIDSIKTLRKEIAQLKDEYTQMYNEAGGSNSDELQAKLNSIANAQKLLNDVMGNTKNSVSQADKALANLYDTTKMGDKSVNELRSDLKMLTAVLNDMKPGPEWDQLNQKVLEVNSKLKELEQSHGDYRRSVGSYAKIFDNFEKGANIIKQSGNDIQGAASAIMGAMNLTKEETEQMNGELGKFRSVLQIVGGAKGVAGLVKNMKDWTTATKAQTTAQKAQDVQTKASGASMNTMAAAEGTATVATNVLNTALKALPFVAIIGAITLLFTHLEEIGIAFQKLGQKLGIFKKNEDSLKGSAEKLSKKFAEQNEKLQDQQKLDRARGVSNTTLLKQQKDLYEQQLKDIQAKKADIQARISQLQADSAWVRFWKGENKKIKEYQAELTEIDKIITDLTKNVKDINIDIQVEGINAGNKAAEKQNEEYKKAAEKAASEIEKIKDKQYKNEVEKVKDTYKKTYEILDSGETAEIKLLMTKRGKKVRVANDEDKELLAIKKKYADARAEATRQELLDTQKATKQMMQNANSAALRYRAFVNGMAEENRTFHQAIYALFPDDTTSQIEDDITIIEDKIYALQGDVIAILGNVKELSEKDFKEIAGMTNETIMDLYAELLHNENAFVEKYGQPYTEAIKIISANLTEQTRLVHDKTILMLKDLKDDIEKELSRGDTGQMNLLFEQLMGKADDPWIAEGVRIFINSVKAQYVKQIMEEGNPLKMNDTFFSWFKEGLQGNIDKSLDDLEMLKAELGTMVEGTEPYLAKLDAIKNKEAELHEARMKQITEWGAVAEVYLNSYGATTEKMLNSISTLWSKVIDIKENNLKKDLESGKISEAEYKKQKERNKKSFEALKAIQIASAVVSTAAGVAQALSDPAVPIAELRIANAIAAGIMGAAEIATIAATSLDSGAGSASTSTPQLVDRTPVVQTQSMNPMDYQTPEQQPIKVYVTDHDIVEGVNNYHARVGETSF